MPHLVEEEEAPPDLEAAAEGAKAGVANSRVVSSSSLATAAGVRLNELTDGESSKEVVEASRLRFLPVVGVGGGTGVEVADGEEVKSPLLLLLLLLLLFFDEVALRGVEGDAGAVAVLATGVDVAAGAVTAADDISIEAVDSFDAAGAFFDSFSVFISTSLAADPVRALPLFDAGGVVLVGLVLVGLVLTGVVLAGVVLTGVNFGEVVGTFGIVVVFATGAAVATVPGFSSR